MSRALIFATALALSLGGLAQAQGAAPAAAPARSTSPDAAATPDASASAAAPAASSDFTPGMPVKDSAGQAVGTIKRVGQTPTGTPAAEVTVDGKPIVLALADLTLAPSKDHAISSKSKAELESQAGGAPAKP